MSLRTAVYLDFKATGVAETKRAYTGIVSETRKAAAIEKQLARDVLANEKKTRKDAERTIRRFAQTVSEIAKGKAAAEKAALKSEVEAVKAAERMKRDEAKRTSVEARRLAQADAREFARQAREHQRAWRQQEQQRVHRAREAERRSAASRQSTDDALGNVATGAMGVGSVLFGAGMAYGAENYQRGRQWIGLEDEDALVAKYGAVHLQAQNTADQSRGARSTRDIEALMMRGAEGYGVSPDVTGSMFADIQDNYSDQAGAVVEHFERINEISAAYQASLGGVAQSGSIVMRDLGVTQDQMDEALESMAGSTGSGSVSMGDLSSQFGETPNLLRDTFGDQSTGLAGVQQFSALAQISGRSGVQGNERATALNRFLQELKDPDTRKRLRDATDGRVNIEGRDGRLLPMRDVLQALMSPELSRPGVTEDVFQSIPAQTYLRGLRTGGIGTYDRLMSESNPEAGSQMIAQRMASMRNDPAYLARLDVGRQASTVYRQAPQLIERARQQTGYISDWEAANVGMPSMIRGPLSIAASAAEGIGGFLDRSTGDGSQGAWLRTQREAMPEWMQGAGMDALMDPRIGFRAMMGGDVGGVSGWQGSVGGALAGNDVAGSNMNALVADIIRQTQQVTGTGGAMRSEVTDPLIASNRETATRIEGAIGRLQLTVPPNTGGTTNPTPPPRPAR